MPLDDYGALLQSGFKAYSDPIAFQVGLQQEKLRNQALQAKLAEEATQQKRAQTFDQDLTDALSKGDATSVSSLIMKYPEFADKLKAGWDVRDKAANQKDLTQLGEIYSAASSGNYELAAKAARARLEADKAAGQADPMDEEIVSSLESGDPAKQKQALGMIGIGIAAKTGPEHFGTVYGGLKGGIHMIPEGGVAIDDAGKEVARSPYIKDAKGNLYEREDAVGPTTAAPSSLPDDHATVATTLASAGMPGPVVAGFLGNFHVEGGYDGAKGDGGSAKGIAQWRDKRLTNFERIIGKPPEQADLTDQAKFVAWEMQNPTEAGMTVAQRDRIMAAKTPAEAASLIDRFYERSSGKHRQRRIDAANQFAVADSGSDGAPPGYRLLLSGKQPTKRILTADEAKAKGLPPTQTYQVDEATGDVSPISGTGEDDSLDPQTITFYAQQILAGGQMPTLGMGKSAARARQQIMKEVAKEAGAEGLSGADLATQIAHYQAGKKRIGTLETQLGTIQANEQTAIANGQQFLDRSKELSGQTNYPTVNSITQSYLRHTGDPTIAAMDAAWNTFSTEYAKVISGSPSGAGVLSDSARHEAMDIMRGNYAYPQKVAAFKQMQKDMANRLAAIKGSIRQSYSDLTVHPSQRGSGLPKGAKIVGTYQGKRVIEVNGKRMVEQ